MMKFLLFITKKALTITSVLGALIGLSQTGAAQTQPATFPKIAGYVGIIHPIVTFSSEGTHTNFDGSYTVGMPTGINIIKSSKVGFSFEVVPFVKSEKGVDKMSNFLFHPGVLAPLGHGFTFVGRAAFETSGRYGFTPIINKVVKKNKNSSIFVAVPVPVRFGNDKPTSATIAFQFGLGF
ncbi:hypothetical protein [Desertivirga arenae]|uniref:hypothetical protein n=1 Tax=Desertivirga arenae TaxID=2810309 RepID=UPI001A97C4B7|nr:hypothetical protein [Pedobacter sp. SYSU D00823]